MIGLEVKISSAGLVVNTQKQMRALMRKAGGEVMSAAKAKIKASIGGGRVYYLAGSSGGHGRYKASAPGLAPGSISGKLSASLKVYPFASGLGVAIRSRMFYSLFLEKGAKGGGGSKGSRNKRGKPGTIRQLLPRPFLTVALDERTGSLGNRIRDALEKDIAFKRQK